MNSYSGKSHHCVDICNKLLRDERSAVETYREVLQKFPNEPGIHEFAALLDDHKIAIRDLELQVLYMGGEPARRSHEWNRIHSSIKNSGDLFGDDSVVKALRTAEERILNDYRQTIDDENLLPECLRLCSARLIPLTGSHIQKLAGIRQDYEARFLPVY